VAQHCVGRDEMVRHCGGGACDKGWDSVRNGGEPTSGGRRGIAAV
jgi:hypothetical protein